VPLYRLLFAEIKFSFLSFSISELSIFPFCTLFQFILVHEDCYLFIDLIDLKLKDFSLSCIKPYIQLYLAIKNSVLHPLLSIYLI
jgi:hypothetical protein